MLKFTLDFPNHVYLAPYYKEYLKAAAKLRKVQYRYSRKRLFVNMLTSLGIKEDESYHEFLKCYSLWYENERLALFI